MVGVEGFEPPTLCSQSRCATKLRYTPILSLQASLSARRCGAYNTTKALSCQPLIYKINHKIYSLLILI